MKRLKLMIFEGFLEKGKGVIGAIVVRRLKERGEKAKIGRASCRERVYHDV